MTEFKVGDKVKPKSPLNEEWTEGIVKGFDEDGDPIIETKEAIPGCYNSRYDFLCKKGHYVRHRSYGVELIKKGPKTQPEDFTRFMAYGTGCDNKGKLVRTEKELRDQLKRCSRDSSWTGRILGYKLTPILEAEEHTRLKVFGKKTIIKRKSAAKRRPVGRPKKRK